MKTTHYFDAMRTRSDHALIKDEWAERAIRTPIKETTQDDGRIRRWTVATKMGTRYLRVVLLQNGETVHNAFFDRTFTP